MEYTLDFQVLSNNLENFNSNSFKITLNDGILSDGWFLKEKYLI